MADKRQPADWELRQARTYARWVNMQLARKGYDAIAKEGSDFGESWTDGILCMKLMNALFGVKMPRKYVKNSTNRVMLQSNATQALKMIEAAEVQTVHFKQVNLLDGDFTMLLGFVYKTYLKYNLSSLTTSEVTAKQGLLMWVNKKTKGYKGVDGNVQNFSRDWKNGNAFLALVDRHTSGMVDYNGQYGDTPEEKMIAAFDACEQLGIQKLLEPREDLIEPEKPNEKQVMLYVSEMFTLFSKEDLKENAAQHIANFLQFNRRIDALAGDYEAKFREFQEWVDSKCNDFGSADAPQDQTGCAEASAAYKTFLLEEKPQRMADLVDLQDLFANLQGELKVNGRSAYQPPEDCDPTNLPALKTNLQEAEAEYSQMIRDTRMGFLEKIDNSNVITEEKAKEFERSFDAFDEDKSGYLDKVELKAAFSAVGIALNDADQDRVFEELCDSEKRVDRDSYISYLNSFFSHSDDADSIMKSLQVLGDPDNITPEMFSQHQPLSDEDVEYLMGRAEEGSLAAYVNSIFSQEG